MSAAIAIAAMGMDAALVAEHVAFDALANAVVGLDSPSLGELLAAYEIGRAALVAAACTALELMESPQ